MKEVSLLDLMKDADGYDRTFKRYRVNFPLRVRAAAPAAPMPEDRAGCLPGLTYNLSLSGIGFVCGGPFDPAGLVEIEITLDAQAHRLLARIHWRRQLDLCGEPMYHYGAKFLRTEAALEFIPVAAQFLLAHGHERPARRGAATVGA